MIPFVFTRIAEEHMSRTGYGPYELLGTIPHMLSADDPAGAVEQIDAAYKDIGGGWTDVSGHTLDIEQGELRYPGDPPRVLIASAKLRDEQVLFFNGAWLAVVQPDGTFRTARID